MEIDSLLKQSVEAGASDLHLRAGSAPIMRVQGRLIPLTSGAPPLSAQHTSQVLEFIATQEQLERFSQTRELDFPYSLPSVGRFRVNASLQRGSVALAFRQVPVSIPTLEELHLPAICQNLALSGSGLILVTGPTGSGKSTTLAAMIDHLNRHQARVVVTIEDPIEYLHKDQLCTISQREVGTDTSSFNSALKHALRQDVDVILVGEMRDPETMAACLTAAETGHLVLSTLHTRSAAMALDRIVDVFPPHQQPQIRMQLSLTLEAVLAQTLLHRGDMDGRAPAVEVMIGNSAIRNMIRKGETHQIPNAIQTGAAEGMQSLERALADLYQRDLVAMQDALRAANDPELLRTLLSQRLPVA